MEPIILSALIGGLVSFATSLFGNNAAKKQQKAEQDFNASQADINRDFQTDEREAAQEWNLAQWERENEYNSPANQMKRMAEAGINPAFAAQAIAGGSGAISPSSVAGSSNPQSGALASVPGSYASTMASLLGNSANSAVNTSLTIGQTINQHIHNKNLQRQYDASIENLKSNTAKNFQDAEVGKQQAAYIAEQANRLKMLTPAELEQCKQQTNLIMAQILNTDANTELVEAQTDNTEAQVGLTQAQTYATYQDITESNARIANLDANTSKAVAEACKIYAEKNNVEADTVLKTFENIVKSVEAQAAAEGIVFHASDAVAGAVYEMINGTGTAKDFYQPISDYEKGIIKETGKQSRRTGWSNAASDAASGVAKEGLGTAAKTVAKHLLKIFL